MEHDGRTTDERAGPDRPGRDGPTETYWDGALGPKGYATARDRAAHAIARDFSRLPRHAQAQAVDTALWEVAQLDPTSAPPLALLHTTVRRRAFDELEREVLWSRRTRVETVSMIRDDGTVVVESEPWPGADEAHMVVDVDLEGLWAGAVRRVKAETETRLRSATVRGRADREASHRRVGAVVVAVATLCSREPDARRLWEEDERLTTYLALRAVEHPDWDAYPDRRLPTRSEVARLSSTPDATWQALHGRVVGNAITLLRTALTAESAAVATRASRHGSGSADRSG